MVKLILIFLLISSSLFADEVINEKIKSFIGEKKYIENQDFINIIFSDQNFFYINNTVDSTKIIQTLKENGLLTLFLHQPKELKLTFKTNGSPLLFLKIMADSLRDMGYYRYMITESYLNSSEFLWTISIVSDYATDPINLQKELTKRGSSIVDISKQSLTDWSYNIDISNAFLNYVKLVPDETFELKYSLYPHWLNVSAIKSLSIKSSARSEWYPHISFYDKSLHLIQVIKEDQKYNVLNLDIPSNAYYMKVSDIYTLKNVKDSLILNPSGLR